MAEISTVAATEQCGCDDDLGLCQKHDVESDERLLRHLAEQLHDGLAGVGDLGKVLRKVAKHRNVHPDLLNQLSEHVALEGECWKLVHYVCAVLGISEQDLESR